MTLQRFANTNGRSGDPTKTAKLGPSGPQMVLISTVAVTAIAIAWVLTAAVDDYRIFQEGSVSSSWPTAATSIRVKSAIGLIPIILLASYLAVAGRGSLGKTIGPLTAVAGLILPMVGVFFVSSVTDAAGASESSIFAIDLTASAISNILIVGAWTIARRRSLRAVAAIPVSAAMTVLVSMVLDSLYVYTPINDDGTRIVRHRLTIYSSDSFGSLILTATITFAIVALPTIIFPALIGWAVDMTGRPKPNFPSHQQFHNGRNV